MASAPQNSRSRSQFVIRLPLDLRDRIAAAAKANGRSANAEFLARVEASFQGDLIDLDALADKIAERLRKRRRIKPKVSVPPSEP